MLTNLFTVQMVSDHELDKKTGRESGAQLEGVSFKSCPRLPSLPATLDIYLRFHPLASTAFFLDCHPQRWHLQNSLKNYLWNSFVKSSNCFHSQTSIRCLWHLGSHEVWPFPSYLDIYDIVGGAYHSRYTTLTRQGRM